MEPYVYILEHLQEKKEALEEILLFSGLEEIDKWQASLR